MHEKLDRIPTEMRAFPNWVCWRFENRGGAKPTKVPYTPTTGKRATVTDPATWTTFDNALNILRTTNYYNGIGFVLSKNDPYTFIDLDDTGGAEDQIKIQVGIFEKFASYAERSPSGKGLHIIVKGKRIITKVNGETCVDYTEPADLDRPGRQLASGTFCLQGHDPGSIVYYTNIRVKPLPDDAE